jgi:hypothetical protein
VRIERVVVHGLPLRPADAERLRTAMAAAVTEALAGVSPDAVDTSGDARRGATARLTAGASPAVAGADIGRAVAATLVRPAERRR